MMKWSERQLQVYLKAQHSKANLAQQRLKQQNDAKVHKAKQNVIQAKSERNTNSTKSNVFSFEIATTPPSVNHYWEKSGRGFKLTDKAKDFHAVVRCVVPALMLTTRLKLEVTFHFPDKQTRDIDNFLKATIDSLVKCGFCVDDEQFDELIVRRGNVIRGGYVHIRVSEFIKTLEEA